MKTLVTCIICLLISSACFAQQGINYKAIIKDANGNILASSPVIIEFIIYEGVALTNNVYQESHAINTDANGLAIINISDGTTADDFRLIDWGNDRHFLNVQVDIGSGLVDLGTTEFMSVPYALNAMNVSGLEALDEGNGIGWRLLGRNSDSYDNIGLNAIDFSFINNPALGLGATGNYAFNVGLNNTASGEHALAFGGQSYALNNYAVSIGNNNNVSGLNSTAFGAINQVSGDYSFAAGLNNIISGDNSIALGQQAEALGINSNAIGLGSEAIGDYSTAIGHETMASGLNSIAVGAGANASAIGSVAFGTSNDASGQFSTALGYLSDAIGNYSTAFGRNITSTSYGSFIIGVYNSNDFGNATQWIDTDVLFQIGNGLSDATRSNAFTVLKNGSQMISSSNYGLRITTGNNFGDHGIEINNSGGNGIEINSSGENGLLISGATNDGMVVFADDYGARITGNDIGLYASGGPLQNDIPDIILGSSSLSPFSDDGIISTNPERLGSDMYLRSYDAVVVHLDYDDNESGSFIVRNGLGDNVFTVNESGDVRVNGSVVHSSDKRLKEDISDLSYGLKEILKLQPKSYHWKNLEQDKKSLGLIAQDVKPIISEIVNVKDDDAQTLGISYTELIPVLINAIKEQQDIIKVQNNEIKSLTDRVEALETINN